MNVILTPGFEEFVRRKVEAGDFQSGDEVVSEGLRLLQQRDAQWAAAARAKIDEGWAQAKSGRYAVRKRFGKISRSQGRLADGTSRGMRSYRFTPSAEDGLFDIWAYIAADNPAAAGRVEGEMFQACSGLAARPALRHHRRYLTDKPVRFYPVRGTYLVVCDPATEPLEVIRVLHGTRDVKAELA